jgi:hypothetical protein
MPAPVYSTSFINVAGAGNGLHSVIVPHGFVFVVKMLTTYGAPSFGSQAVNFKSVTSGATFWRSTRLIFSSESDQALVTLAFNQGEEFGFDVVTPALDHVDLYAGGYALRIV